MKKKATKRISVFAVILLAFATLFTALVFLTGNDKAFAFADGEEQGKLLYIVDVGRVNDQNGSQLPYGYGEDSTPTYITSANTFTKRNGGTFDESAVGTLFEGKPLSLLLNSYTDHPFGVDPKTEKSWGFNENYTDDMPHRMGKGGGYSGGYCEFRSVNNPGSETNELLTYKFEVPNANLLDVSVITHTPEIESLGWNTVEGKMSVNDGSAIPLTSERSDRIHSIPECRGVLNSADNKYYLTLNFGNDSAHTVVCGIIIREKLYKVTYTLSGGVNNEANKSSYTQGNGFTLADPTRTGYTFDGWYKAGTTDKITEISNTMAEDIGVYAKWTAATYTVTYNLDGGVNATENAATYTYGKGFTLADPTPPRAGYTFDGWYDAAEGGNKVTAISNTQTGDVTLYAHWTAATYTVTYNLDGGVNNEANTDTYTYGVGLTLMSPTRAGYTFDGWYDAEEDGNKVTAISDTQTGNVTLYARWTKSKSGGCNSSIGGAASLFCGLLLLSAGAVVIVKCKKKN